MCQQKTSPSCDCGCACADCHQCLCYGNYYMRAVREQPVVLLRAGRYLQRELHLPLTSRDKKGRFKSDEAVSGLRYPTRCGEKGYLYVMNPLFEGYATCVECHAPR
jgi:hypothetical protein